MSKLTSRIGARRACRYAAAGRGFTLVELLVVVAIIALLVSILLPSLGKAKEQTRMVVCMTNLKGLGVSFFQYTTKNNYWYPMASGYGGVKPVWDTILQPHYQEYGLLHCPSDTLPRYYEDRDIPQARRHPRSYAINLAVTHMGPSWWGDANGYGGWYGNDRWPGGVHKATEVTKPAETILLGEMWDSWYYGPTPVAGICGEYKGHGIQPWYRPGREATADVHRNNDAANYLFCDGHAILIPADEPNLNWQNDYNYWWRTK